MRLFDPVDGVLVDEDGALVTYVPRLVAAEGCADRLRDGCRFEQLALRTPSGVVPFPRLVAWHADPGVLYPYAGVTQRQAPWTSALAELRDVVADRFGVRANGALVNLYRDGRDHMGWHSDDEAALVAGAPVVSLSFGAERRFDLRRRDRTGGVVGVVLGDGSALVMAGRTQEVFEHRLPRCRDVGFRVNVTFRVVVS